LKYTLIFYIANTMWRYSNLTNYIQELCIEICFVMNLKFSYFWGCWYLLRTNKLHFLIKNYFNSKTSKISYEHQGVSNEHFEVNYFIVCNKRLFLKYFEVCSFEGDLPPYFFLWVKGRILIKELTNETGNQAKFSKNTKIEQQTIT